MAIKRRHRINPNFSMASMTDVIFLLLIFFMVTSTVVFPNAIKVNLPQSSQQAAAKPLSRVTIDANLNYYVAFGNEREQATDAEHLLDFLLKTQEREPEMFVAIYADESVPYGEVVKILDWANQYNLKMVLATAPQRDK
ncbi:MAG: biopolymer transporter ExbD [Bacteroidaceae bacterium]|nr:biopolymer transporter ExbD [Bacteroidales bacterium]MBQ2979593.1 biopolymer transporter ExbD [Bacteroidaceae bacterium]